MCRAPRPAPVEGNDNHAGGLPEPSPWCAAVASVYDFSLPMDIPTVPPYPRGDLQDGSVSRILSSRANSV